LGFLGFRFQGFRVSGFRVSSQSVSVSVSGSVSVSVSGPATRDPRHSTCGDRQGRFPEPSADALKRALKATLFGFRVSWFRGFWFLGFRVSGFHPNRGRDRDRYRDRLFNHEHTGWHCSGFWERQGEFLIFMKFHVFHGFIQIGVGVGIGIGIAIGIVDPRPATFDPRRSAGMPALPANQERSRFSGVASVRG